MCKDTCTFFVSIGENFSFVDCKPIILIIWCRSDLQRLCVYLVTLLQKWKWRCCLNFIVSTVLFPAASKKVFSNRNEWNVARSPMIAQNWTLLPYLVRISRFNLYPQNSKDGISLDVIGRSLRCSKTTKKAGFMLNLCSSVLISLEVARVW